MDQTARHIIFTGYVQGVGFRFTAHRIATRHGLTGWVKNLPDGTVEVLVQGPPDDIENCLTDLKELFAGYLKETKIQEIPPAPQHTDFRISFYPNPLEQPCDTHEALIRELRPNHRSRSLYLY
jgi:acylphosphatase